MTRGGGASILIDDYETLCSAFKESISTMRTALAFGQRSRQMSESRQPPRRRCRNCPRPPRLHADAPSHGPYNPSEEINPPKTLVETVHPRLPARLPLRLHRAIRHPSML